MSYVEVDEIKTLHDRLLRDIGDGREHTLYELSNRLAGNLRAPARENRDECLFFIEALRSTAFALKEWDFRQTDSTLSDFLNAFGNPKLLFRLPIDWESLCLEYCKPEAEVLMGTDHFFDLHLPKLLNDPWGIREVARVRPSRVDACFDSFRTITHAWFAECTRIASRGKSPLETWSFDPDAQGMDYEGVLVNLRDALKDDRFRCLKLDMLDRYQTLEGVLDAQVGSGPIFTSDHSGLNSPNWIQWCILECWKEAASAIRFRVAYHTLLPGAPITLIEG